MAGLALLALSLVALVAVAFVLRGENGEDTDVETTADNDRVPQIPLPREGESSVREGRSVC